MADLYNPFALDILQRALRGEVRMNDWPTALFAASSAALVWATRTRAKRRTARDAWLDGEQLCGYLDCAAKHPRRGMRRVFANPDGSWVWMCPRCFKAFGHQYRSEKA
jgi:hypothetical protein